MSYRSILLFLDQDPVCERRTQYAIELARAHEAHIIGLAATDVAKLPLAVDGAASLIDYADIAWRAMRSQAETAARMFTEVCEKNDFASFETLIDESAPAASLVRRAPMADLVIVGQADPSAPDAGRATAIVEEVVLYSPRPTLVIPYAGKFEGGGRTVLAAWNGSREAARALSDALPMMRRAERVHLVNWYEGIDEASEERRLDLDEARLWLARHGIAAVSHSERMVDLGIADAMLSRVADLGADLIVMGAYGHARWRERVFGGATRGLMASMTVPVLMSH